MLGGVGGKAHVGQIAGKNLSLTQLCLVCDKEKWNELQGRCTLLVSDCLSYSINDVWLQQAATFEGVYFGKASPLSLQHWYYGFVPWYPPTCQNTSVWMHWLLPSEE